MRIEQKSKSEVVEVGDVGAGAVVNYIGLTCVVSDRDDGDGRIHLVDLADGESFQLANDAEVTVHSDAQLVL